MATWTQEDLDRIAQKRRQTAQADAGAIIPSKVGKRAKYGNKAVLVDLGPSGELVGGKLRLVHTFDSQREADYYQDLVLCRRGGTIRDLELQRPYALIAHAQAAAPKIIGYYEADFVFYDVVMKKLRIVDVKGMKTQVYALKKKIVEAYWGIEIEEV